MTTKNTEGFDITEHLRKHILTKWKTFLKIFRNTCQEEKYDLGHMHIITHPYDDENIKIKFLSLVLIITRRNPENIYFAYTITTSPTELYLVDYNTDTNSASETYIDDYVESFKLAEDLHENQPVLMYTKTDGSVHVYQYDVSIGNFVSNFPNSNNNSLW